MRAAAVLLLALLCFPASPAAAADPTPAALRKAFENNRHTVVKVKGPKASGAGVIVGASGHVLTSVEHVGLEAAEVELDGATVSARVLMADAYQGVALVQMEGTFRAAPVRLEAELFRGQKLVAIRLGASGPAPEVVAVRRAVKDRPGEFDLDRTVPKGTPIFDAKGKLLGVVVRARRVVPVANLRSKLVSAG